MCVCVCVCAEHTHALYTKTVIITIEAQTSNILEREIMSSQNSIIDSIYSVPSLTAQLEKLYKTLLIFCFGSETAERGTVSPSSVNLTTLNYIGS